jgi:hypothetical protein
MKQEQPHQVTQSFIINSEVLEYSGIEKTDKENTFTAPFLLGAAAVISYLRNFHEHQHQRLSCSILLFSNYKIIEKNYSLIKTQGVITKVNSALKKSVISSIKKDIWVFNQGYKDTIIFYPDKILIHLGGINYYRIILTPYPIEEQHEEPEHNIWID